MLTVSGLAIVACGGDDDDDAVEQDDAPTQDDAGTEPTDDGQSTDEPDSDDGESESESDGESEPSGEPASDDDTADGTPVVETLPPEEDAEPVAGGTLRYGMDAEVDGLNPTSSALAPSGVLMGNAVFDTLAADTDDGYTPFLAESFTPSDDFTSWTMKLREGITFHDGTPANADAVIVNFEAQRTHPLVGLAVKPFFPEDGAIEKVDDLTVTYNLSEPNAYFPARLTDQLGMLASPAWLAAIVDDGTLSQAPVGTGPFVFDGRSEDSVTRFVRNESWWAGDVYLDAVEFFPVPDSATRVDLLVGDDLDALHTTSQAAILELRDDERFQNVLNDASEESFAMMNTAAPPFDDLRARQALTLATPRDAYLALIGLGVNRAADQRFIPESPYYNPDVKQAADRPDEAADLAAEYCAERGSEENPVTGTPTCTDGKINIEFQWSGPSVEQTRIAELATTGWSVAFNVIPNELLQDEHVSQTAFGQYNVNTWRQFGAADPSDDNHWLMCRNIGGISINWPRYCDEERDALLLAAQATTDPAERADLYQQAEARINEAATYIFFYHTLWDNAFDSDVHGVCDNESPDGVLLACSSNGVTRFGSVWMD